MKKAILLIIFGLVWVDDLPRLRNRQSMRYNSTQIEDLILTINHLQSPIH